VWPDSLDSKYVYDEITQWKIYHFHDTSATAPMRGWEIIEDNKTLRSDAANIAPFLLKLREHHDREYNEILGVCKMILPYF
jgi:predicted ATPase